ncbi:trypsin-like peptidase domain-containing protein [Streptomyces sp. NPDC050418]|uniref:S1C family serine protease n=1 Tax=Streptomyces sp. NPDC050418 TaxID=3365612 RepID=UPI00379F4C31
MDDGKPTGPKAKWWSRPRSSEGPAPAAGASGGDAFDGDYPLSAPMAAATGSGTAAGPDAAPHEPSNGFTGTGVGAADATDAPTSPHDAVPTDSVPAERPSPLHEPDPYSTPPYGGPGPWAPAPPVQHPVATPAQGTPLPPAAVAGHGASATYPQSGQAISGGAPIPPAHPAPAHPAPAPQAQVPPTPAPGTPVAPHPTQGAPAHGAQPPQGAPQPHAAQPHVTQPHGVHIPQQPGAPGQAAPSHAQAAPHETPGAQQPPAGAGQAAPAPGNPAAPNGNGPWATYDPWRSPQQPLLPSAGIGEAPRKKSRKGLLVLGAVALALVTGGIGGGVGAYIERNGGVGEVELGQSGEESRDRAPDSVAGIAASALPSVVTLHVSGGGGEGTGTGFVLDRKGHILTNNHVVDPGGSDGKISVTFSGGETASAKIVGRDAGYDLAVVKVSGVKGLKPLPLGNSDNVEVGDPVVAIGAPFDLSNTVTSGIISAKERPITAGGEADGSDVSYVNALQTDAPINPGNSGGPLVDSKARVIGINSAIRSAGNGGDADGGQAGSIGLGFAIPINQGKRVAEQLINEGKATHPVIEVTLDTEFLGDGARVAEEAAGGSPAVKPGGPGAKAGIKPGDVITEVDGQKIHSGEELIVKIRSHEPGDRLELTIERDDKERKVSLTLGEAGD